MIILYIGNVGYPDTASSIHVRNRAIFMKSCGHEVHILCELASDGKRMEEVDEVTYQYMDPYPGRGKVRGAFWNLDQVFGKFYFKQTLKFLDKIKPDIIILYEPNSILYVLKMLNLSKKEGFKLVIETTEWRNPKDYKGIISRVINTEKDLQKKYIDIWKNELDFAVDKFNNILTPTDKEDFFQIQKAWESSTLDQINFERDYISNQEEYNINLGTSFQYLNLSEIRESYRERTFQIKYLLYLYEQSNTKISESDYQSLVFSSD